VYTVSLQVWLGIGDALAEAVEQGKLPLLQAMYDEWPFFRGLLDLVEMVMAKADPRVTAMYDAKLVRPELQVRAADRCVPCCLI
jgi:phosphoenolpyruvate carboxylase